MRRARAFTLIELLVVIAVVAILLALVGPSMGDLLASQRVRNINAQLVTDIQYARSEAALRNTTVSVLFRRTPPLGTPTMTCYVLAMEGGTGDCDCDGCYSTWQEIRRIQIPGSTTVTVLPVAGQAEEVKFDQRGRQLASQPIAVAVFSSRRGKLLTRVNLAGRPSVCSPDGSIRDVPACP